MRAPVVGTVAPDERFAAFVPGDEHVLGARTTSSHRSAPSEAPASHATHLLADLAGVPVELLQDTDLLRGLLIAGASAAALKPNGIPAAPGGSGPERSLVLIVAGGHIAAHTFPERSLLLLDVLCDARHDPRRVLDVFVRRLSARDVRIETRSRA